jgi:hypothetical protein
MTDWLIGSDILKLGGAGVAVVAVSNALYKVFRVPPMPTALAVSIAIAIIRVIVSTPEDWLEWPLSIVNGCVLFCTAAGMNDFAGRKPKRRRLAPDEDQESGFFVPWFEGRWR